MRVIWEKEIPNTTYFYEENKIFRLAKDGEIYGIPRNM